MQMNEETRKTQIRQKVFAILKGSSPESAIPPLFQIESSLPEHLRSLVRQPMLFVFQNQHDWDSIIKCLKAWGGMYAWLRIFYERMKKRLQETPQANLADHELMPEVTKLINKHQSMYEKRKPLVPNIDKYLKKEEEDKNSNTVKSGRSIKSIQSVKSIGSVKSNPAPQSKTITQSVQPPKSLQGVQQTKTIQSYQIPNSNQSVASVKSVQSVQSSNQPQSTKNNQTVQSASQQTNQVQPIKATNSLQNLPVSNAENVRKNEVQKPQMPKMSKISRMTEHYDPEGLNQNSATSNKDQKRFNMIKKPNIPLFRKEVKDDNPNASSNPPNRNQKRLTFGISDQLRGTLRFMTKQAQDPQKKKQLNNETKTQNQNEEKITNNQNFNAANIKIQEAPKEVPKAPEAKKPQNIQKPNVFERKEQVPIRVNPIFITSKKDLNPSQTQDQQKAHEASVSRSITPHKPLIERKKIVLKKPTDFKPNVSADSSFEEDCQNHISVVNHNDEVFFSERKPAGRSVQIEEVEELKKEIQSASDGPSTNNQRLNPQRQAQKHHQKQSQQSQSQQSHPLPKPESQPNQLKKQSLQQNIRKHAQISHSSITRRQDQLFSDYEVSLMSFNPYEMSNEVNLYNILKKLDLNVVEEHNQWMRKELDEMKRRRGERPRRNKL